MTRIASAMLPQAAMGDLGKAQRNLAEAARQSSAQTRADDLRGYGREAQTLISAQRLAARSEGFIQTADELRTRMQLQDVALGRAAEAVSQLKQDLFQSVSLEDGTGIRARLEETFAILKDAINMSVGGRYLFGGVLSDRPPITADTLDDLAANPLASSIEQGAEPQLVRVEEGRNIAAGPVADDFLTTALESLKRLAEFDQGPGGPFNGRMTAAQSAAVQSEIGALSGAFDDLLSAQSENGRLLKDAESSQSRQEGQLGALNAAIGGIVDVDLAEVAVKLNQAQFAYQASASVFNTIRQLTLLNFLD